MWTGTFPILDESLGSRIYLQIQGRYHVRDKNGLLVNSNMFEFSIEHGIHTQYLPDYLDIVSDFYLNHSEWERSPLACIRTSNLVCCFELQYCLSLSHACNQPIYEWNYLTSSWARMGELIQIKNQMQKWPMYVSALIFQGISEVL